MKSIPLLDRSAVSEDPDLIESVGEADLFEASPEKSACPEVERRSE